MMNDDFLTSSVTTRRGFVAAASLGAVSLYGLWAGLGAAPLRFWSAADGGETGGVADTGHGGHGDHGMARGPSPDEFRAEVERFIVAHRQPDGSVLVEAASGGNMEGMDMSDMSQMEGHSMDHGGGGAADVFLLAQQWSYDPAWLTLRAGVPYRLKLMAVDMAHGASIHLGPASLIVRLPQGVLVERQITFTRPGSYLVYCTVYCGEAHQAMSGKLDIV